MRKRLVPQRRHVESIQRGEPQVVRLEGAARFVTLDDPALPPTLAQGAFCRLAPPEDMAPDEVASWRDQVARVARAVRVLPQLRSADVALTNARACEDERVGSIREEAEALAAETGDSAVKALVSAALDEVGA
jgi:hypothetical protein